MASKIKCPTPILPPDLKGSRIASDPALRPAAQFSHAASSCRRGREGGSGEARTQHHALDAGHLPACSAWYAGTRGSEAGRHLSRANDTDRHIVGLATSWLQRQRTASGFSSKKKATSTYYLWLS